MSANGPWPGKPGLIPVTDGKADDANVTTRNYLDSIHIEERLIGSVKADTQIVIFGKTYSSISEQEGNRIEEVHPHH